MCVGVMFIRLLVEGESACRSFFLMVNDVYGYWNRTG